MHVIRVLECRPGAPGGLTTQICTERGCSSEVVSSADGYRRCYYHEKVRAGLITRTRAGDGTMVRPVDLSHAEREAADRAYRYYLSSLFEGLSSGT